MMQEQVMRSSFNAGVATKVILGLSLVSLGILLAADNLDLINSGRYLRYWPAAILLIGLVQVFAGSRIFGVILSVIGASLLAANVGLVRFTVFDLFWPVVLIGVGGLLVARAVGYRWQQHLPEPGRTVWAIMSTPKVDITDKDFRSLNTVAFMGGSEIDLRQADITHGPAVIDCLAVWGGIEITVPPQFDIVGEVVPFMGGFEITTVPGGNRDKQLIIRGVACMGGIEVKGKA
jgi:predicted membrane protein